MSVYSDAKLLLIPSGVKVGKLYSQKPTDGTGDFTVDRNSTATRVNSLGLIEEVGVNVPRIDYSSGEAVLLREPQSTNLLTYSDGNLLTYPIIGGSISDALIPINSFTNSIQVIDNSVLSYIYKAYIPTIGVTYTLSLFVQMDDGLEPVITQLLGSGDFSIVMSGSTSLTNIIIKRIGLTNVYKISANYTSPTTNTNFGVIKYTGQSSRGFKFSGIQLEQGSATTSYIPTTTTAVTRLQDVITVTPPLGVTEIIETIDGVDQTPITVIPTTYQIPNGNINKIVMK